MLDAVHADLSARWPVTPLSIRARGKSWEEEIGEPPRWEEAWFRATVAGVEVQCRANSGFEGMEVQFFAWLSFAKPPAERWALVAGPAARASLRTLGFGRHGAIDHAQWTAAEADLATAAILGLADVDLRVLAERDLPEGKWPWAGFLETALFADEILDRTPEGSYTRLRTRIDGRDRAVLIRSDGSGGEEALLAWWLANPPALRTVTEWRALQTT